MDKCGTFFVVCPLAGIAAAGQTPPFALIDWARYRACQRLGAIFACALSAREKIIARTCSRATRSPQRRLQNCAPRRGYSLPAGTMVMLGSILRYPRPSIIQGCSRYGGNSSAAILGSNTGFRTLTAAFCSFVEYSRLLNAEYAFIAAFPSPRRCLQGGVGLCGGG